MDQGKDRANIDPAISVGWTAGARAMQLEALQVIDTLIVLGRSGYSVGRQLALVRQLEHCRSQLAESKIPEAVNV